MVKRMIVAALVIAGVGGAAGLVAGIVISRRLRSPQEAQGSDPSTDPEVN